MPYISRSIRNLALFLTATIVALALIELCLRLFAPQQLVFIPSDIFVPDDALGYNARPNLATTINTGAREVRLITDANGHRIGASSRPDPTYRILALGDSFLQGLQVAFEDTMTARLERQLSSAFGQTVEIVNAGVTGQNPNQYLLRAKRELMGGTFDMIITFVYIGNDLQTHRVQRYPPRSPTIHHVLQIPSSLSQDEWKNKVFYPINDFLEHRSHLFVSARYHARVLLAKLGLTTYYYPAEINTDMAESSAWGITGDILGDVGEEAISHCVPAIFVLLPAVYQVNEERLREYQQMFSIEPKATDLDQPNRRLKEEMERRGLIVVDTMPALRAAQIAGRRELYGRGDIHFGPDGHEIVANMLSQFLLSNERLLRLQGHQDCNDPRAAPFSGHDCGRDRAGALRQASAPFRTASTSRLRKKGFGVHPLPLHLAYPIRDAQHLVGLWGTKILFRNLLVDKT